MDLFELFQAGIHKRAELGQNPSSLSQPASPLGALSLCPLARSLGGRSFSFFVTWPALTAETAIPDNTGIIFAQLPLANASSCVAPYRRRLNSPHPNLSLAWTESATHTSGTSTCRPCSHWTFKRRNRYAGDQEDILGAHDHERH